MLSLLIVDHLLIETDQICFYCEVCANDWMIKAVFIDQESDI